MSASISTRRRLIVSRQASPPGMRHGLRPPASDPTSTAGVTQAGLPWRMNTDLRDQLLAVLVEERTDVADEVPLVLLLADVDDDAPLGQVLRRLGGVGGEQPGDVVGTRDVPGV